MTLLLVEDSRLFRGRLARVLHEAEELHQSGEPVEIVEADTAEGALLHLRTWSPEVVLLDLQLREGTGFDVLESMQAERLTTPVVVLANRAEPWVRERCLRAGARGFFDKALEFEQAVAALGRLAQEARQEAVDHR